MSTLMRSRVPTRVWPSCGYQFIAKFIEDRTVVESALEAADSQVDDLDATLAAPRQLSRQGRCGRVAGIKDEDTVVDE